jgi:hypothetical protein
MVVGHLCGPFGRKPSPAKVEDISAMKHDCKSVTEVRRFLEACGFYHIWILHYAHIAEPLYGLLKKGRKFEWRTEHMESVQKMKEALAAVPVLRRGIYDRGVPVYITVDTSPTGIGWVINQEGENGERFPIWFGAKVLSERQRGYAQVKRELWGIFLAVKADRDHLIGTEVVIEIYCLPILSMVSGCTTPDLAMFRWIAYIKSLNPHIQHISGKNNATADILSRARFDDEGGMVSEDEDIGVDFFEAVHLMTERGSTPTLNEFDESMYDGEWLLIGMFLKMMTPAAEWKREEACRIQKRVYRFFLRDGRIWKHRKKKNGVPL